MRQSWVKEFPPVTEDGIRNFTRAIGDSNPIHHDDEAAKVAGLYGIIAPGVMTIGFVSSAIADEIPYSKIGKLEMKFRSPLYAGALPVASCRVLHFSKNIGAAQIAVTITNGMERVAEGTCLVTLPKQAQLQKVA